MLNRLAKAPDRQVHRRATSRRRRLAAELRRCLQVEPLEQRRLLASDVVVGINDVPNSYVRTPGAVEVVYSPTQDSAQIGQANIFDDLNAGLMVIIDTVNPTGSQEGNITLNAANLPLVNAVNTVLNLQADNDVVIGNSRVDAMVGSLTLILNSDRDESGAGRVEINAATQIMTNGGDVTIGGGADPLTTPAIGNFLGADGISILGTINSADGNISMIGLGVAGNADDSDGIFVQGTISTALGDVMLQGFGGNSTGVGNDGIELNSGIVNSLAGNVMLGGMGGGMGNNQHGVQLTNTAQVSVANGSLTVAGTGSAAGMGIGVLLTAGTDAVQSQGAAPIVIDASGSGGAPGLQSSGTIGGANATGDITFITDGLELVGTTVSVQSTGNLLLQPKNGAATIGIGGGAGILNISDSEIASLVDGFASITIGDPVAGSGAVDVDSVTFTDPVQMVGGSIDVSNGLTGDGGITLTTRDAATGGQDVNINTGVVTDNSGSVAIHAGDDFLLAPGTSINTTGTSTITVNLDPSPDADAGTGSTANLRGTLSGAGGAAINGGVDTDTVTLDKAIAALMVLANGPESGVITADVDALNYAEIEFISVTQQTVDANVTFSAANETLTVSQPSALSTMVASDAGTSISLLNPTNAFTIDTGTGNDTVDVAAVSLTVADKLTIQDGDALPNDTFNLNNAVTINTGGLSVVAEQVNVNADLSVDAAVSLGTPLVPAARVTLNGVIVDTAAGPIQFESPVAVAADSVVTSGAQLQFSSTLDGSANLSVTAGNDVAFVAAVGSTTPLASLTVEATGGQVTASADVTTVGDQVYRSALTADAAGMQTLESQNGSVVLQSSLEFARAADLTIRSNAVAQFGGDIGANNPPQSLTVQTAGPFSIGTAITALMDVSVSVTDTPLDSDDLTLSPGAAVVSTGGNVNLSAGDDFESQSGAAINGLVITVNVDPVAGDADASGGTATIDGNMTTGVVGGALNVNGGDDADTFVPIAQVAASYDGGDPTAAPGDTMIIDGSGGTVTISETTIQTDDHPPLSFANLENLIVNNATAIDYLGGAGNDVLTLSANPLPATTAAFQVGNGPTITFDPAVATALGFRGGDGDDTLSMDVTNGILNTTVTFDGEGNTGTDPGDQIAIVGTPAAPLDSTEYNFINASDGSVVLDGLLTINYQGLEPISSVVASDQVTLNYSPASEMIAVSQVGAELTVTSTAGETTTFVAPSNDLTIDTGGGADSVTVDGLTIDLAGTFRVNDPDDPGDDTVVFSTAATTISTGRLDLAVPLIQLDADLTVDGDVALGSGTGVGQIQTSAAIVSAGEIIFNEAVTLAGATTVITDADSQVGFRFAIDGDQNLTVTGGTGVEFLAQNGATTPLASLTATATAGSIRVNSFNTTGNQTYNAPVLTGARGGTVNLISSGGDLIFGSTIDNGSEPADSLVTNSNGVTTLGGATGGIDPLDTFSIRASGTITLASAITVLNDVLVSTSSSGDDSLVIQSPAMITTGPTGSIRLTIHDNVDIQSGSMISTPTLDIAVDASSAADDVGVGSIVQIQGTLNVANSTSIEGGDDDDVFRITPQAGSALDVSGGNPLTPPGDLLVIDAGGADITVDVAAAAITVAGTSPVNADGMERIDLSNASQLTIQGSNGPDNVTITGDPNLAGGDVLTIDANSQYLIRSIDSLVYNGGGGDDSLTFDVTNGVVTTPVTFHGQDQQAGGTGDRMTVQGTVTTQVLTYSAPAADGNSGSISLDGAILTYTGLEPITAANSADTVLNFDTGLANDATLQNSLGSVGAIELLDNGSTFEDTILPNPTNSLTINLGDQGDTLAVDPLSVDYAASMIINGGDGIDDVQLDGVMISNTPGRGLEVVDVETLGITDSVFSGNTAAVGAGLRVIGGVTTIDGSTFSGNTATGDAADQGGGGIFNDGVMTIRNGSIVMGNSAIGSGGSGGGILVGSNGTLTVLDSTITGNSANRAGGGIETQSGNDLTLSNVIVDSNRAGLTPLAASPGNGGGLHVTGGARTLISGGTVSNNMAAAEGGGLWNDSGVMTINGGAVIQSNTAAGDLDPGSVLADLQGGGGIFNNGGSLEINDVGGAVVIQNNQASGATRGSGGGLMSIAGTVNIAGASILSNEAVRAGGGVEVVNGQVTVQQSVIRDNDVSDADLLGLGLGATAGNGGGLHVTGAANVTIDSTGVFDNSAGREGGGLWNNTGIMTVQNGAMIGDNRASGAAANEGGGGIFNNGGTLNITGPQTAIRTNLADGVNGSGGGIHSAGGTVTITAAMIDANTATMDGGGLFATGVPASVVVSDGAFFDNVAGDSGGALFIDGPTTTITNTMIVDNQAQGNQGSDGNGGGLFVRGQAGSGDFSITNASINNNTAVGGGGGVLLVDIDGTISGGNVDANQVAGDGTSFDTGGGGLAIIGQTRVPAVTVSGVTVDANSSPSAGGIAIVDARATIDSSAVSNNVASSPLASGGGIGAVATAPIAGDFVSIQDSEITDNFAAGEGGGVDVIDGSLSVSATTISSNQAAGGRGGGIRVLSNGASAAATIRNSTLSMNTASQAGGGLAASNVGLDLENVTISGNDAGTLGGGIGYSNNSGTINSRISFSTLTSNTARAGGSNIAASGQPIDVVGSIFNDGDMAATAGVLNSLGFNLDSGDTSGFSNQTDLVNSDPLLGPLQDNGGPVLTHALLTGSPAVDAAGSIGPMTDARGVARPIDGDANGSLLFDIGALESEVPFSLVIDDVNVDEDAGNAIVTVRSLAAVPAGFTVDYVISDDTATLPADYTTAGGTLTFAGTANETQTFLVSIVDDAIVEDDETLMIGLTNPSNSIVDVTDSAVLTINDDDIATLAVDDVTVNEGDRFATVTVAVDNAVEGGFTVDYSTFDGSATQPDDYLEAVGVLTFNGDAGETQSFTVEIIDDATVESSETVAIELASPSHAKVDVSDTAVLTIDDNDAATLTVDDVLVDESGESATVTVSLDNDVDNGLTVEFTTSDGTATQPGDYVSASGTLTFLGDAGESQTFTVQIVDDAIAEPAETILIDLANPSNAAVDATDRAVIRITDNDVASISFNDVIVNEDEGFATVTATLVAAVQGGLTVDYQTSEGTAKQPGDYTAVTGTLSFVGIVGETQTLNVPIVDDSVVEPDESFTVSLLNPSNNTVDVSATSLLTITDNDRATIQVGDVSVDENAGSALVSVTVMNGVVVQGGFTVDYRTVDGTARHPGDYEMTSGTLTIGSALLPIIEIPIVADAIPEENEQFTIVLSNVVPLGDNPAPAASIDATDIGTVVITEVPLTNVDLRAVITDAPDPVIAGGELVYTVTVSNLGMNAATGVVSTTTLPAGLVTTAVNTSAGTVDFDSGVVTGNIPRLDGGQSETITIRATAPDVPAVIAVIAATTSVASIENDTDLTNNLSTENTTVTALPSTIINGTVTCDIFANAVNEPIADAVVFLDANNDGLFDPGERSVTTDPSGFFQFDNVLDTDVNVTVEVPATCQAISEEPGVRRSIVPIGHLARSIASADIDLDGDLDLLVAGDVNLNGDQDQSDSLTVVQNNDNEFSSGNVIRLGDRPQSVFAFQPNPAQPVLLAVAGVGSSGNGGAVYTIQGQDEPVRHQGVGGPIDVLIDDLNMDGLPDVVSASLRSILELRLGGTDEVLAVPSDTSQILSIASGNLTASATREVVVAGYGFKPDPDLPGLPTKLEIYGASDQGIAARLASIDTPPEAVKVAVVDIIGNDPSDGIDDNVEEIAVLFHTGQMMVYPMVNGTIGNPIVTPIGAGATAFDFSDRLDANDQFVDFNRDGHVDVAIARLGSGTIDLFVGSGDGRFSQYSTINDVFAPSDIVVDDFSGDGFADVAVSSFFGDTNVGGVPGNISRAGYATILQLQIASRSVSVTPGTTTTEHFIFRSAFPQILMDTTGDNVISPLDALRVVNVMGRELAADGEQVGVGRAATDVNGDGTTSAIDALMIINYLGRESAESTGEASQVMIDALAISGDDDDLRDDKVAAIDLAMRRGLF